MFQVTEPHVLTNFIAISFVAAFNKTFTLFINIFVHQNVNMPRKTQRRRRSYSSRRRNKNVNHSRHSKHFISNITKSIEEDYVAKKFGNSLIIPLKKNLTNLLQYSIIKFIISTLNSMQHYIMGPIESPIDHQELIREENIRTTSSNYSEFDSYSDNYSCDNEEANTSLTISTHSSASLSKSPCDESDCDYESSSLSSSKVSEEIAEIFERASPSSTASTDESDENIYYDENDNKFKRHSDIELCHYFISQQQEIFNDENSTEESDNCSFLPSPIQFSDKFAHVNDNYVDDNIDIEHTTKSPIARPGLLPPNNFFALENYHGFTDKIGTSEELRIRHWHDTFALDKSMLHLQIGCH